MFVYCCLSGVIKNNNNTIVVDPTEFQVVKVQACFNAVTAADHYLGKLVSAPAEFRYNRDLYMLLLVIGRILS